MVWLTPARRSTPSFRSSGRLRRLNSAVPIASRKNPLEIAFVASTKNPLQMRAQKWWQFASCLQRCARVSDAGAEDRATLESDPSAVASEYTDGQGQALCPFFCPSGTP